MTNVRRVGDTLDVLGEGPIWDVQEQAFYWTDIRNRLVRALLNFFIEEDVRAGYTEVSPPILVNAASATANSLIGTIDQSKRAVLRRLANDSDSLTEATRTYASNKIATNQTAVTTALQRIATDFPTTLPMADQPCP